jgi:hypothetical protein
VEKCRKCGITAKIHREMKHEVLKTFWAGLKGSRVHFGKFTKSLGHPPCDVSMIMLTLREASMILELSTIFHDHGKMKIQEKIVMNQ